MAQRQRSPPGGNQFLHAQSSPDRINERVRLDTPLTSFARPAFGSTTSEQSTTSAPVSPYPGLERNQLKKFNTAFTKTDSKINTLLELLRMAGVEMDKEDVINLIANWADLKPEVRTFSKLTAQDYCKLCDPGIQNDICINDDLLASTVPDTIIPPEFLRTLYTTRSVSSRTTKMGTRGVINVFLNMAVYIARGVFNEHRLVIHHEWNSMPIDIPGVGCVGGPLDYVTSRVYGKKSMGTFLHSSHTNV
jgi:hypothetical protein